jgi:uncharacterized protein
MSATASAAIQLYIEAAQHALEGAEFNLEHEYPGIAANRAYYAYFYAASALLLTQNVTRSKHSGVLSAFREYFVKSGLIEPEFSDAYGEAFSVRQHVDYEMMGSGDEERAAHVLGAAQRFVARAEAYLKESGYL